MAFQDETHQVFNQASPLIDYNLYLSDPTLQQAVRRFDADWGEPELQLLGQTYGSAQVNEWAVQANAHPPEFISHDLYGRRVDLVRYHPAYHALMKLGIESGTTARPWSDAKPGAQVFRAAQMYLHNQVEQGSSCPLTMTYAVYPALKHAPALLKQWQPRLFSCQYDPANKAYFDKAGVTIGMAMTEKQGGSDVRANTTRAELVDAGEDLYQLVGHKWFCSAPMSDGFLMLAQTDGGLSCFLVPRWSPDGSKNPIHIQQLKNKLGNRSNASSEIEIKGALGWLVGEAGRGVRTIIEMVSATRFDCLLGSAAMMRQAVVQAVHHCQQRHAFGKALTQQSLMRNVLADLALESEASLWLAMRLAAVMDQSDHAADEKHRALLRLGTPAAKFWHCKRAITHIHEAQECLGGTGYIEEHILPRLYREAPVNSIWEGSGNIQCLDVLRAISRAPEQLELLIAQFRQWQDLHPAIGIGIDQLQVTLLAGHDHEWLARQSTEVLAKLLQATTLAEFASTELAELYCETRLGRNGLLGYGNLPMQDSFNHTCEGLLQRAGLSPG